MPGRPGGTLSYPELIPIHAAIVAAIPPPHGGGHTTGVSVPTIPDQFTVVAATRNLFPTPLGARHLDCLRSIAISIGLGAGLLSKPDGFNIGGFASDIIAFQDGEAWDVLADAEGEARPRWAYAGQLDPARYRAVTSTPGPRDDLSARVAALEQRLERLFTVLRGV